MAKICLELENVQLVNQGKTTKDSLFAIASPKTVNLTCKTAYLLIGETCCCSGWTKASCLVCSDFLASMKRSRLLDLHEVNV